MKTSVEIPDELVKKIKEYNNTHKGKPINVSGVLQERLENIFNPESDDEIIIDVDAMYDNWWELLETKPECRLWLKKKLREDPPKFTPFPLSPKGAPAPSVPPSPPQEV